MKFYNLGDKTFEADFNSYFVLDHPIISISRNQYILIDLLFVIIYLQSECTEKYQFELCSKYDREHDFDVKLGSFYHVASWNGYVVGMQMMSHDKLKYQVSQQFNIAVR